MGKNNKKKLAITRFVEEGRNTYGDKIMKTVGIRLVQNKKELIQDFTENGKRRTLRKTVIEIFASVRTKLEVWRFEKAKSEIDVALEKIRKIEPVLS